MALVIVDRRFRPAVWRAAMERPEPSVSLESSYLSPTLELRFVTVLIVTPTSEQNEASPTGPYRRFDRDCMAKLSSGSLTRPLDPQRAFGCAAVSGPSLTAPSRAAGTVTA